MPRYPRRVAVHAGQGQGLHNGKLIVYPVGVVLADRAVKGRFTEIHGPASQGLLRLHGPLGGLYGAPRAQGLRHGLGRVQGRASRGQLHILTLHPARQQGC